MSEKSKNYDVFSLQSLLRGELPKPYGSRDVPMKVLCLGFSRTGTISLKKALERLGYGKCYHMSELVIHPEHLDHWDRATRAKWEGGPPVSKADWDKVLAKYQAGADNPFAAFAAELIELYPHAKIILTNKHPDAFWRSWYNATSFSARVPWHLRIMKRVFDPFSRSAETRRVGIMTRILNHQFDGKPYDEETVKRVFQEHYDTVRSLVPKERLLDYSIEDGWEPICRFLGEAVPEEDFPKGNSTNDFRSAVSLIWKVQTGILSIQGMLLAGGLWLGWRVAIRHGYSLKYFKKLLN